MFYLGSMGKDVLSPAEQWDMVWRFLLQGGLEAATRPWALAASLLSRSSSSPTCGVM